MHGGRRARQSATSPSSRWSLRRARTARGPARAAVHQRRASHGTGADVRDATEDAHFLPMMCAASTAMPVQGRRRRPGDSEAVRRIFSGVCHNVFRELRPVRRDSGSGGTDAAGLWGQIGGPTVLAVAVTRVGRGNRDRRDACRGAWDQLAGVEAAGYAVHGGLIGDRTITSLEKIARGPIYPAEGAGSRPRSARWAGSSRERARTRSAWATRPFADAAGVLATVDTGTGRGVSTFPIRSLMLRGPTRSRAGRRRLHPGAGVLAEGRSGAPGRRRPDPACHGGLGRRRDASGIG